MALPITVAPAAPVAPEPKSRCRPDILIHAEQVGRVKFLFQRHEPPEIAAVGGPDARGALVGHHEVHVAASGIEAMDGLPVVFWPHREMTGASLSGIGIDPRDDHRPGRIAGSSMRWRPSRDLVHRAVDRIEVHQRQTAQARAPRARRGPRWRRPIASSRSRLSSTTAGQALRQQRIEQALQGPGTA